MNTPVVREQGSDRMPTFADATVADVMHPGVLSCPPETELVVVARTMAANRIHSVVVTGVEPATGGERLVWSLLSDLDLVAAARLRGVETEAGQVAATEIVSVDPDDSLEHAAQLMVEHQVSHLLVASRKTRMPIGVLSTLDIAGALSWTED